MLLQSICLCLSLLIAGGGVQEDWLRPYQPIGHWLEKPEVQAELKLSQHQRKSLQSLAEGLAEASDKVFNAVTPLDEIIAKRKQLDQHFDAQVKSLLSPPQKVRLQQIAFHAYGILAVTFPEVGKRIGLSDRQQKRVQAVAAKFEKQVSKLPLPASGERARLLRRQKHRVSYILPGDAKLLALLSESESKVKLLLTPRQRRAWDRMIGKPFKLP